MPLAACLALLPAASLALTASDDEGCRADLAALQAVVGVSATGTEPGEFLPDGGPVFRDGQCELPVLRIPLPSGSFRQEYRLAPIRWLAEWADDSRPMPPANLSLDIPDIRQRFDPDGEGGVDPAFAYQMELISDINSFALHLDYSYASETGQFDLTKFSFGDDGDNRMTLSASLSGADLAGIFAAGPSGPPPLDKLATIRLNDATLTLGNGGFFETMTMGWLNLIQPAFGPTPKEAVEGVKLYARDQIAAMPETLIADDGRAALTALVDSLPHPLGTLTLRLDAPEGIVPGRFAMTAALVENPGWASFEPLLDGARIEAEWQPAPPRD